MILLPIDTSGSRTFEIDTGEEVFSFRTYYSGGQQDVWLMDISHVDGTELLTGIALIPGARNLLRGQGDILEDYKLYVTLWDGESGALDAPGKYLFALFFLPGEDVDDTLGIVREDILLTIEKDQEWAQPWLA